MSYVSDDPEQEFEVELVVTAKGFGRLRHQDELAAEIKRAIEIKVGEVTVMRDMGETLVLVERIDRNAKQARGEA